MLEDRLEGLEDRLTPPGGGLGFLPSRRTGIRPVNLGWSSGMKRIPGDLPLGRQPLSILICMLIFISILIANLESEIWIEH